VSQTTTAMAITAMASKEINVRLDLSMIDSASDRS
jgi:hypothetical protein